MLDENNEASEIETNSCTITVEKIIKYKGDRLKVCIDMACSYKCFWTGVCSKIINLDTGETLSAVWKPRFGWIGGENASFDGEEKFYDDAKDELLKYAHEIEREREEINEVSEMEKILEYKRERLKAHRFFLGEKGDFYDDAEDELISYEDEIKRRRRKWRR